MAGRAANRVLQLQAPLAFEGRVHKWEQRWLPVVKGTISNEVRLELQKWVRTDEMSVQPKGPRHPHLRPVTSERNKAVRIPSLQQPSQGQPGSQQAEPMQVETSSQPTQQHTVQPAQHPAPQPTQHPAPQPTQHHIPQPTGHAEQPQQLQPQQAQPHQPHHDVVMHSEQPAAHQLQSPTQEPLPGVAHIATSQQPAPQPTGNYEHGVAPAWPQVQGAQEAAPSSLPDNTPRFH